MTVLYSCILNQAQFIALNWPLCISMQVLRCTRGDECKNGLQKCVRIAVRGGRLQELGVKGEGCKSVAGNL